MSFLKPTSLLLFIAFTTSIFAQKSHRKIDNNNENKRCFTFDYEISGISQGKMARFQQRIPSGFIFNIENSDVHVFETSNIITLIWQKLPKDSILKFSFDIIAPSDVQGTFHLGDAAFMSFDNQNQVVKISYKPCPILINETSFSIAHSNAIVKNLQIPCGEEPEPIVEVERGEDVLDNMMIATNDSVTQNYYYRIQLSASKSKQNKEDFKKYIIGKDQIFEENHQGMFKYSIGTFYSYEEGQNRVKQYLNLRNLQGFLVGYIENQRHDLLKMPDYRK